MKKKNDGRKKAIPLLKYLSQINVQKNAKIKILTKRNELVVIDCSTLQHLHLTILNTWKQKFERFKKRP